MKKAMVMTEKEELEIRKCTIKGGDVGNHPVAPPQARTPRTGMLLDRQTFATRMK
jgi:hypothetical protein